MTESKLPPATNSTSAIFEAAVPITYRAALPMESPLLVDMALQEPVAAEVEA